ncbi:MAG: acetyl-CoA hydrolase/transferase C-terminal domain-containing protein [Pseudomonadota bacterium]
MTERLDSVEAAADAIIAATGGSILLGMPLGLGKPNRLANVLYRRAVDDPRLSLTIATALSLTRPKAPPGLQQRFLKPFVERVYGDYEELEYLHASRGKTLPDNVQVIEFFVQPAAELSNSYAQQNYISANYTHIARDMMRRGINVLAQTVAPHPEGNQSLVSLSCNPEMTLDMLPAIADRKARGETLITVGQLHPDLPYMTNSAEVSTEHFDLLIDDAASHSTLISTPNLPVDMPEHFIGLAASGLVRDGGTLQIGIGALGDAVASALLLRHQDNQRWQQLMDAAELNDGLFDGFEEGGRDSFEQGLYGCSEMFTYGLYRLFEAGVIKRSVAGSRGQPVSMHGGFFLGPQAFYQALRDLAPEQRSLIEMTNISFVNGLYGQEDLKREQRLHGRFINTAFTVTMMGAAVADQLADGRILSGVGGQYNFVAQAHELEGARSILLVRATRSKGGETTSNLVWNYGHTTIPRHLRDIVITEYGAADLRGKTDAEVIAAMLGVADSRFQGELMERAKSEGKLPTEYRLPRAYTHNTPERLRAVYEANRDCFPEFPLGSDFTYTEEMLLRALVWLKANVKPSGLLEMARSGPADEQTRQHFHPHLQRMGLEEPQSLKEKLYQQLLLKALQATEQVA